MKLPFEINIRGKLVEKGWNPLKAVLANLAQSPLFQAKLASSFATPIRRNLDYQGIARKTFLVEQLPDGALPIYTREETFKHDKFVITPKGKLLKREEYEAQRAFGQRVMVPTFEVFQNPSIRITDVKQRRFNLIDRHVQKARQQIMKQEDDQIFELLDAAGKQ